MNEEINFINKKIKQISSKLNKTSQKKTNSVWCTFSILLFLLLDSTGKYCLKKM